MMGNKVLIGLNNGTIREQQIVGATGQNLIQSHNDGEVWGLSMIDEAGTYRYITSGDDDQLLLYDIQLKKVIGLGTVHSTQPIKAFKGGASSLSTLPANCQARAISYNHQLNHLAVGHNDGTVSIRLVEGLEAGQGHELIKLDNII